MSLKTYLKSIINTQKTYSLDQNKWLCFKVDRSMSKIDIRNAVHKTFPKADIQSIKTLNYKPIACRFRGNRGVKAGFKKAYVSFNSMEGIKNAKA